MTALENLRILRQVKGALRAVPLRPLAMFVIAFWSWSAAYLQLPTDPRTLRWLQLVHQLALTLVPLFGSFTVSSLVASHIQPVSALMRALHGSLILGMTLGVAAMLISTMGDRGFALVDESPADAVMYAAVLLLGAYAWKSAKAVTRADEGASAQGLSGHAGAFELSLSLNDADRIAAHEAGHVLLYAALGEDLPDVVVTLRTSPDSKGSLGSVTSVGSADRLPQMGFVEWEMLVFLAGAEAELLLEGSYSLGASDDKQRWLSLAKRYLTALPGQHVYHHESHTPAEIEGNSVAISALHDAQIIVVRAFLSTNRGVLEDIANQLKDRKKLKRDDLLPHLKRVVIPRGLPLPVPADRLFSAGAQPVLGARVE